MTTYNSDNCFGDAYSNSIFFGASHAFVLCKVVATTVYIDNTLNKAQ